MSLFTPTQFITTSGTFLDDTGSLVLPAGFQILTLVSREIAGFAVPAGILFGSTPGGVDIGSMSLAANAISAYALITGFSPISGPVSALAGIVSAFSISAPTPIYIRAGSRNITGVTRANPAVVSSVAHGFVNGQSVTFSGVVGMTQLNGNSYTVAGASANSFQLSGVDSTGFGAYISGGVVGGWGGAQAVITLQLAQFA